MENREHAKALPTLSVLSTTWLCTTLRGRHTGTDKLRRGVRGPFCRDVPKDQNGSRGCWIPFDFVPTLMCSVVILKIYLNMVLENRTKFAFDDGAFQGWKQ